MAKTRTIVTFDPDILYRADHYVLDQKRAGVSFNRSQLIGLALTEYLNRHDPSISDLVIDRIARAKRPEARGEERT